MVSKRVVGLVLRRLAAHYKSHTALESFARRKHETPFQILVATMLSARTRDEVTAQVSDALFAVYPTPKKLAAAPLVRIKALIKPVNFYKGKAKRIKQMAKIIHEKYRGEVPKTMKELDSLPGVGRKTAGCVRVYAFGLPQIPVDVHCHRVANRLGWVKTKTPEKTEFELEALIPKHYWLNVNELFVLHGQQTCLPRKPRCCECVIKKACRSNNCKS
ncbi:MAG: endonuclease III [Candidatus Norongarragalinales archaeon]